MAGKGEQMIYLGQLADVMGLEIFWCHAATHAVYKPWQYDFLNIVH
jgi:hypothetical protein